MKQNIQRKLSCLSLILALLGGSGCASGPGFVGCLDIKVVTGPNSAPVLNARLAVTHTDGSGSEAVGPVVTQYAAQGACSGEMSISVTHPMYYPVTVIHRPSRDRAWQTNTFSDSITIVLSPR